ncbi:hypothetical protein E4U42_001464 [Claviceps africana]|uniref:Protein phosphatase n=1 Tax=Claviceps africana TaxID=83212 RepID=A0A8K0JBS0_9HYPO|nr:hypothetical protein E4U42_001464 [Claviceps africana]
MAAASPVRIAATATAKNPWWIYHIAASFIGKDRPYDPSSHVFHFNPYNRIQSSWPRRPRSRPDSGHDAFFVSRIQDTGSVAFGVADGVGGWVDSGVNPADFSHGLCNYMAASAYAHDADKNVRLTARRLLETGYDAVCNDRSLHAGGSTACVGIAAPDGTLNLANLGDSGFLQLRLNAVNAYSEPQTHGFNTPFQLSLVPPSLAARMAAFGGSQLCDLPRDADVSQHYVRHGDILMLATDGVFDNLFRHDILRIVSRVMVSSGAWQRTPTGSVRVGDTVDSLTKPPSFTGATSDPDGSMTKAKHTTLQSLLATEIVAAAKAASTNTKVDGPFAKEVQKYYPGDRWRGGKVDDICVVVAVVLEDSGSARSKL